MIERIISFGTGEFVDLQRERLVEAGQQFRVRPFFAIDEDAEMTEPRPSVLHRTPTVTSNESNWRPAGTR